LHSLTQLFIKKLQLKDKSFLTATCFGSSYGAIFKLCPKKCTISNAL